ncbi:hypothetical protein EON81_04700, partial [bacterium]
MDSTYLAQHVPLAAIGAAFYFLIAWLGPSGSIPMRSLTTAALLTSVSLTLYALIEVGATCSWCLASAFATCVLAAVAWLTPAEFPPSKRHWTLLVSLCGAIFAVALWGPWREFVQGNPKAIRAASSQELFPESAPTLGDSKHASERLAVWVDMECSACRAALPNLILWQSQSSRRAVFFRHYLHAGHAFAKDHGERLVRASRQGRLERWLREFAARNPQTEVGLHELESEVLQKGRPLDITAAVDQDRLLAKRLGLEATPFAILKQKDRRPEAIDPRRLSLPQ